MPTTTNYGWPTPSDTDLVRDGAEAIRDLGSAIDTSLGNTIIAVKHVLKTDTFSASVAAGANVAVSGTNALSITHEVADATNKLIISAFFGAAAGTDGRGPVGIAVDDGTGLIGVGDTDGDRTRVSAGGRVAASANNEVVTMPSILFVHTPGTGSKTYTVRAINIRGDTETLFINRSENDIDTIPRVRAASGLTIMEVKA